MDDKYYMQQAIDLAARGEGFTSPNPVVGAVVIKKDRIVGRGWHEAAGRPHAEVVAIDDAGSQAKGADLYVTLEPCHHTGRTPPCTRKILESGISRVVIGMRDPNPHVTGGGADYLRDRGLSVVVGVEKDQIARQLEWFVKYVRTGRPLVTLKCALTLDGCLATRTGDAKWVTGEAARAHVHYLRHISDAIMVGSQTVKTDDPRLTARLEGQNTRDPQRIILDSGLGIDENARLLHLDSDAETILVVGGDYDHQKRKRLEDAGIRVMETEQKNGHIDLAMLMKRLGEMEITSLLIEGGAQVAGAALAAHIVDKVCLFYAPKILGGDDGIPMCRGKGPERMQDALSVKNVSTERYGTDIMI